MLSLFFRKYLHEECDQIKKIITKDIQFKLISLKLDTVTRLNRAFLGINIQYIVDDSIIHKTIGLIELTKSHIGKNIHLV